MKLPSKRSCSARGKPQPDVTEIRNEEKRDNNKALLYDTSPI